MCLAQQDSLVAFLRLHLRACKVCSVPVPLPYCRQLARLMEDELFKNAKLSGGSALLQAESALDIAEGGGRWNVRTRSVLLFIRILVCLR